MILSCDEGVIIIDGVLATSCADAEISCPESILLDEILLFKESNSLFHYNMLIFKLCPSFLCCATPIAG